MSADQSSPLLPSELPLKGSSDETTTAEATLAQPQSVEGAFYEPPTSPTPDAETHVTDTNLELPLQLLDDRGNNLRVGPQAQNYKSPYSSVDASKDNFTPTHNSFVQTPTIYHENPKFRGYGRSASLVDAVGTPTSGGMGDDASIEGGKDRPFKELQEKQMRIHALTYQLEGAKKIASQALENERRSEAELSTERARRERENNYFSGQLIAAQSIANQETARVRELEKEVAKKDRQLKRKQDEIDSINTYKRITKKKAKTLKRNADELSRNLSDLFGDVDDDELQEPKEGKASPQEAVVAQEQGGEVEGTAAKTYPEAMILD
ncbi:hypothetical protein EG329_004270 [Mollisiaceae sp. DMI_Dod_QoI]|nr:hypothetical protein EG329_004270 [Helotiales sp. DMI_Dod_QoI]